MCNRHKKQDGIIWFGIALSIFMFFLFVGESNKESDAELSAHHYCKMVYHGDWPDYQKNYDKFCIRDRWNGK